jgi:hypothetical protein
MGSSSSKQAEKKEDVSTQSDAHRSNNHNKICIDCQKDQQVDLPNSTLGVKDAEMDPCIAEYQTVDQCMKQHHGQVSSCKNEWNIFQMCFITQKPPQ